MSTVKELWDAGAPQAPQGFTNWGDLLSTILTDATAAAAVDTLVKRDAEGRFKAAGPSASDDVAIKDTVDNYGLPGGSVDASVGSNSFPLGLTIQTAGTGYPTGQAGMVIVAKATNTRVAQMFVAVSAASDDRRSWIRYGYNDVWSPWRMLGSPIQWASIEDVTFSGSTTASKSVSFPSNLFPSTPAILLTVFSGAGDTNGMTLRASSASASGFTLLATAASSITGTHSVSVFAVERK